MMLIANTGLQFIKSVINLSAPSVNKISFYYAEQKYTEEDGGRSVDFIIAHKRTEENDFILKASTRFGGLYLNTEAVNPATWRVTDEAAIRPDRVEPLADDEVLSIRLDNALDLVEDEWLPLPYFKEKSDGTDVHEGPTAWARMILRRISTTNPDSKAGTHYLIIAFDTSILSEKRKTYLCPTQLDVDNQSRFRCATDEKNVASFLSNDWVGSWLESVRRRRTQQTRNSSELYEVACYFLLMKVLGETGKLNRIELARGDHSIEVDLVLDIGNARTCGLVIETAVPGQEMVMIQNARRLKIRDLSEPDQVYQEPFDMRVAFAKCSFGRESVSELEGNNQLFVWPSLMRIGKEANEYAVRYDTSSDVNSTNSSPKKYLWDTRPRQVDNWHSISRNYGDKTIALGGVSVFFNDEGVLLERTNAQNPSTHALYSRSSLMTFAFIEIILQALTYVNSLEYREDLGNDSMRRVLKRIVLTCPTAMLDAEKFTLRQHATDAVSALRSFYKNQGSLFGQSPIEIIPSLSDLNKNRDAATQEESRSWGFDEATCSQLVFLYGEICHKFQGKQERFFNLFGKMRETNQPSLTVASVDIGGGTTDLMICNYEPLTDARATVLTPRPLFWEGFNRAGDVITKSIIERIVLPTIQDFAQSKGGSEARIHEAMRFLFGKDVEGQKYSDKMRRKKFANHVAYPMALGILQFATSPSGANVYQFADFFINLPYPQEDVLSHINREFKEAGCTDFSLKDIVFTLNEESVNRVISDVMEKMLRDLCLVIEQFNCDFVLLSGRPAMIPIIRDIFVRYLPVTPDRIISLGNYKIGEWYPFADTNGVIRDPKTTVVVGAAIALLAGRLNRLPDFRLDVSRLISDFRSTADYVGRLNVREGRIEENDVYFLPNTTTAQVRFDAMTTLGFKQFNQSDWIATPMYKLDFAQPQLGEKYANRLPLLVQIERDERNKNDKESLTISLVTDSRGNEVPKRDLMLRLQTLVEDEGHWLDTGIFNLNLNIGTSL